VCCLPIEQGEEKRSDEMGKIVRIEGWRVISRETGCDVPPEKSKGARICGNFFGHPQISPGGPATTSCIVSAGQEEGVIVCESRPYQLGKVDPQYEAKFPRARERLLRSLPSESPQQLVPA